MDARGPGERLMSGGHARSLLERAVDAGRDAPMLTEQYRMHPDICRTVSRLFYEEKLLTAPRLSRTMFAGRPVVWREEDGDERAYEHAGYSNEAQAEACVMEAVAARLHRRDCTVFIISYYNKQRSALLRRLKQAAPAEAALLRGVEVLSVDSVQGSEADVVIVTTVRSAAGPGGRSLGGFMADPARLNVAISRARESCVVVGHGATMARCTGALWAAVVGDYRNAQLQLALPIVNLSCRS